MLGTKYSEALGANFIDADGHERPFVMGSYGIGITRSAQAAVEAFHDEKGIIWPKTIAPYDFHIIPIDIAEERIKKTAFDIYQGLLDRGFEVLLDLVGTPVRIAVGARGLDRGQVEIVRRRDLEVEMAALDKSVEKAVEIWENL